MKICKNIIVIASLIFVGCLDKNFVDPTPLNDASIDAKNESDSAVYSEWGEVCEKSLEIGDNLEKCNECTAQAINRSGNVCAKESIICEEEDECTLFAMCTGDSSSTMTHEECKTMYPKGEKAFRDFFDCFCKSCHEFCCYTCQGYYGNFNWSTDYSTRL